MQYIDEKFKDSSPAETVTKIQGILKGIGVEVVEKWYDSGIENCYSLSVSGPGGVPSSNGKGITKEFARASAYGEFIERLQGGLFFYKFQSIIRNSDMNIQSFAPDAKYMTVEELIENGEWMDVIIDTYKNPFITREALADQCLIYSCSDNGKVLTIPFYSIFEKKYVYLPIGFVDQIYATNGCCVGNTREEAWVHALSEIMERHANLEIFTSGKSAPKIPDEVIARYPVVSAIINEIRANGKFDIDIFDYSIGNGFPVVSTRIINKENLSYRVNVAADPVFEIALQRTLTELMQGKNIHNFTAGHGGKIIGKVTDFPLTSNITNQLESSNGIYTADFFANELTCDRKATEFADNSNKTNKELLDYLLSLYTQLGKPVYVRNFSYLGFPCYRFVVPGFSEALAVRLGELVPEYAIADDAAKTMRNIANAEESDLALLISHTKTLKTMTGRYSHFGRISGVPISGPCLSLLNGVTRAYASYRLGQYSNAINFLTPCTKSEYLDEDLRKYLTCINKFVELKALNISEDKLRIILQKFFEKHHFERLCAALDSGKTPYDEFLLECDYKSCSTCKYKESCCYEAAKDINTKAGAVYKNFVHGQDESEFTI